jgi:hypothetical protein
VIAEALVLIDPFPAFSDLFFDFSVILEWERLEILLLLLEEDFLLC